MGTLRHTSARVRKQCSSKAMVEMECSVGFWYRVHHRDRRAVTMADRHYSRQHPGTPEFTRPGHKIVLLHVAPDGTPAALWASQRPAPGSGAVRADGRDCWDCSIFRVEARTVPASALIREAVAITWGKWREIPPSDGFITTINPRKVQPVMRRNRPLWGYCFLKAGWRLLPELTRARKLVLWELPISQLAQVEPVEPMYESRQLALAL
jgi:hypothetical protein